MNNIMEMILKTFTDGILLCRMVVTLDCDPNAGQIKTKSISVLFIWSKPSSAVEFFGRVYFLN